MFALVNQNPIRFFLTIIPKDYPELLRCRLVREPTSVMPMFHLEMEFESESEPGNKLVFGRLILLRLEIDSICLDSIVNCEETDETLWWFSI